MRKEKKRETTQYLWKQNKRKIEMGGNEKRNEWMETEVGAASIYRQGAPTQNGNFTDTYFLGKNEKEK